MGITKHLLDVGLRTLGAAVIIVQCHTGMCNGVRETVSRLFRRLRSSRQRARGSLWGYISRAVVC